MAKSDMTQFWKFRVNEYAGVITISSEFKLASASASNLNSKFRVNDVAQVQINSIPGLV